MSVDISNSALFRLLHGTSRLLRWYESVLLIIASAGILATMIVTSLDVIFRYGFHSPIGWWFDVVSNYLLVATFFLGFSYTLAHHGHLAIDFFAPHFPRPLLHVLLGITYALASVLLWIIVHATALDAFDAWQKNDVFAGTILWPVWISKMIPALGMLPLMVRTIYLSVGHILAFFHPQAEALLGVHAVPRSIEGELA